MTINPLFNYKKSMAKELKIIGVPIMSSREGRSRYPYYYVILSAINDVKWQKPQDEISEFLMPLAITQEQHQSLEELVVSEGLKGALDQFHSHMPLYEAAMRSDNGHYRKERRHKKLFRTIFGRTLKKEDYKILEVLDVEIRETITASTIVSKKVEKLLEIPVSEFNGRYSDIIAELETAQHEFDRLLQNASGSEAFRNGIGLALDIYNSSSFPRYSQAEQDTIMSCLFCSYLDHLRMLNEFLKTKIRRVHALKQVDKFLALAYLNFSFSIKNGTREMCSEYVYKEQLPVAQNPAAKSIFSDLLDYIEADNCLYKNIVSHGVRAASSETLSQKGAPYVQIVLNNLNNGRAANRIDEPIPIDKDSRRKLSSFASSSRLNRAIRSYRKDNDEFQPETVTEIVRFPLKAYNIVEIEDIQVAKLGRDRLSKFGEYYNKLCDKIEEHMSSSELETNIERALLGMEHTQLLLADLFVDGREKDTLLENFRVLLRKYFRPNDQTPTAKDAKTEYFNFQLHNYALLSEFLKAKIARTKALMEFDSELALAYLHFTPRQMFAAKAISRGRYQDTETMHNLSLRNLRMSQLHDYIVHDSEFYGEILANCFEAKKIDGIDAAATIGTNGTSSSQPGAETANPTNPDNNLLYDTLLDAVLSSPFPAYLPDDMRLRIKYFAEDAVDLVGKKDAVNLLDGKSAADLSTAENLDSLCDAFSRFRFDRRLRNKEKLPEPMKIRNFFDDVTIKYLRKGNIPEAKDLERLYTAA